MYLKPSVLVSLVLGLLIGLSVGLPAWLSAVNVPNSFNGGETAVAADVNENFDVLAAAITANEQQLASLQGSIGPSQQGGTENVPVFRWATWSTYGQGHGSWYANNDNEFFGGGYPSNWGDSNGRADQMILDPEILATLFNKKLYPGSNATVYAEEWGYHSSTNSRHAAALFRINNTTDTSISWPISFYYTAYANFNEIASLALNGSNIWDSGGQNVGPSANTSQNLDLRPGMNTVIVVSSSSGPDGTRSCFLAFFNDCLKLPAGLEYVDDIGQYSPSWTEKIVDGATGSPAARNYQTMVWDGTRAIMFGGTPGSNVGFNDTWQYDCASNEWTEIIADGEAASPQRRYGQAMVWDGTQVIMFGGWDGSMELNDTWCYNPVTETWTEMLPTGSPSPRDGHQMVWDTLNRRVVMYGGNATDSDTYFYNPVGNAWTSASISGPNAKDEHRMVWDGERAILFGGFEGGATPTNDVWCFDPVGDTWQLQIANGTSGSPAARAAHDMTLDGDLMLMFGGTIGGGSGFNDLWFYNQAENTWTELIPDGTPGSPDGRLVHSLIKVDGKVLLFAGVVNGGYRNDLWWLTARSP